MVRIQNLGIRLLVSSIFLILFLQLGISQGSQVHYLGILHKTNNDTIPDYSVELLYKNQYHNLSQVYKELEMFNNNASELIAYSSIGKSFFNNSIPLITITNENILESQKAKTLLIAHHHAREACTIETTLRLIPRAVVISRLSIPARIMAPILVFS